MHEVLFTLSANMGNPLVDTVRLAKIPRKLGEDHYPQGICGLEGKKDR